MRIRIVSRLRSKSASSIKREDTWCLKLLALVPLVILVGCDPVRGVDFALVPSPAASVDSTKQIAFALATRIGAKYGLTEIGRRSFETADSSQCVMGASTRLCAITDRYLIRFDLIQAGAMRFSPRVQQLRREFEDSLRARFGPEQVRDCDMKVERDPTRKSTFWRKYNRAVCIPRERKPA